MRAKKALHSAGVTTTSTFREGLAADAGAGSVGRCSQAGGPQEALEARDANCPTWRW